MTLRFEVDQAEAFRRGVNVPKSTNHVDIDPAKLPQEVRDLIADRLDGIDVCELDEQGEKCYRHNPEDDGWREVPTQVPMRVTAKLPTFEALMEAVRENERHVKRNG